MMSREAFDAWWSDFQQAHEEWRFADREALLFAAYQAGVAAPTPEVKPVGYVSDVTLEKIKNESGCDVEIDIWKQKDTVAPHPEDERHYYNKPLYTCPTPSSELVKAAREFVDLYKDEMLGEKSDTFKALRAALDKVKP